MKNEYGDTIRYDSVRNTGSPQHFIRHLILLKETFIALLCESRCGALRYWTSLTKDTEALHDANGMPDPRQVGADSAPE